MARYRTLGWTAKLVAAAMLLAGTSTADAAWWSGTYYPTYRAAYYRAQPYYAYYGAAYAPVAAAPTACQTCRPATCGTCVQRVCSYVPQTNYQVAYRDVPVTSYHPVTTIDHCSGCSYTSYRPVTTCARQAYYVPYTTYRPVCTNVAISTAPAVAYYAAPAVAVAAAPATGSCCGGAPTTAAPSYGTPGAVSAPSGSTNGSGLPAPAIEPSTEVPNASGQSILEGTQTGNATNQPTPVQQTNGWRFGGPAPTSNAPLPSPPRDRTAANDAANSAATAFRPASLSMPAMEPAKQPARTVSSGIVPAGIVPAGSVQAPADANGWHAAD